MRKFFVFAVAVFAVSAWGQAKTTFQDLYVIDDTTLGSSSGDSLTINAATSYVGPLLFGDGTVGAPAVSFSADTDVGMWRSAANTLNFSVAGAEVCEFGATANSIGNASDTTTLLGALRIGTGSTPGTTLADDGLFVEGKAEVDGILDIDSTSDFAGDAVFNEDVSLCVGSDDKVTFTSGYFTKFRVGTGSSPGVTLANDGAFIEGACEVDGELQADGIFDANDSSDFAGDAVFNEDVSLGVGSDDKVTMTDGYFTQFRIGTGSTPATAMAADNAFIEGQLELDGALDADSTGNFADTVTFSKGSGVAADISSGGELNVDGTIDANSTSNFADTATFAKGSGVAADISTGGELNIDGTLDANGTSDFGDTGTFSKGSGNALVVSAGGTLDANGPSDFADTATFSKGSGVAADISSGGELNIDGTLDANSTSDFADTATFSKGSGVAADISAGGELNIDGTLDANSTSDFADTVVLSKGSGDALQVSSGGTADFDGNVEVAAVLSYGVGTLPDTDTTPDVSTATIWQSQSNTGATAITDLDNPVVGAIYYLIVNHANNPPTITDGGNFALSANWTPGIDDVLILYVQADNDYIEVGRVDN